MQTYHVLTQTSLLPPFFASSSIYMYYPCLLSTSSISTPHCFSPLNYTSLKYVPICVHAHTLLFSLLQSFSNQLPFYSAGIPLSSLTSLSSSVHSSVLHSSPLLSVPHHPTLIITDKHNKSLTSVLWCD